MSTRTNKSAYDELLERYSRIHKLSDSALFLAWDQRVMMPSGGAPGRAEQLSALSATRHELLVDDRMGELLDEIDTDAISPAEAACVREIRHEYERAARVPSSLVEAITRTASENQEIWDQAKADDDFAAFAPRLEKLRELQIERAEHIDPDAEPYDVLVEDSFPFLPVETLDDIFETLRTELPPLVDAIRESSVEPAAPFDGVYAEADQRELSEEVLDWLGYDRDHGRLDEAAHPFMAGNQFDARVTTRYGEDNPMEALLATIHEFGHASYELGLPRDAYGSPLGKSRRSVHESQSRFWENHIGRSRAFWDVFAGTVGDYLGIPDLSAREAYENANRVRPDNLIRVEADEVTYHLHILLRCEIDRAYIAGEIDVMDIPTVWNETMDEYLGVTPDTDAEGCLQDIHWTSSFASFQTYTFGSMVAAQLDQAIRRDLDVDDRVRSREFDVLRDWMVENVHQHGQRYETEDLVEQATGEKPSADPYVDYVKEKFGALYGF